MTLIYKIPGAELAPWSVGDWMLFYYTVLVDPNSLGPELVQISDVEWTAI